MISYSSIHSRDLENNKNYVLNANLKSEGGFKVGQILIFWENGSFCLVEALSSTNIRQISICKMACLKEAWKLLEKPHLAKLYVRKNPVGISMFCDLKLRKHQTQGYPLTSLLTESLVNVAFSANNNLLLVNHFRSCPICADICAGECFTVLTF